MREFKTLLYITYLSAAWDNWQPRAQSLSCATCHGLKIRISGTGRISVVEHLACGGSGMQHVDAKREETSSKLSLPTNLVYCSLPIRCGPVKEYCNGISQAYSRGRFCAEADPDCSDPILCTLPRTLKHLFTCSCQRWRRVIGWRSCTFGGQRYDSLWP